jgi:uncharacterized protein DUF5818
MRFLLNLSLLGVLLTSLVAAAQQPQPSHPVDPTQQAPATPPQQSTPPTFPPTAAQPDQGQPNSAEASPDTNRTFMGTIILNRGSYLLRAGDKEYKLDDPSKAKKYVGKDVKVLGRLDKQNNVLHVENIEIHPSM